MKNYLLLCIVGLMAACSPSTQITKTWTDPSWTPGGAEPFKKVLVLASLKDASSQRIAEDKVVAAITKVQAVQSYKYLQAGDTVQARVEEKLRKDGFDGIIVMRLANVDKSLSYTPGTAYGGWYGYRYATPGYYSEDQTYTVTTDFYSILQNKLIWSGTTSTLNPTQFDKTVDDIIAAVKNELVSKGLIKP